ncbi:MAG: RIP metalloprotease RseP [Aquabacterium sp.]
MLTTALYFLLTIGVLVVIHEYGHYRAAVACDVKVLRFSVGFGRVLWRRQRGETEFVVSALPLGGYVRMLDEREGRVPSSELSRAFNRKPLKQRAFIVAAGPAANLLLAVALYAAVNWTGVQELRPWLSAPLPGSMAADAGLQSGDEVVAWRSASEQGDGVDWQSVRSLSELQWLFTRATLRGEDVMLQVRTRVREDEEGRGARTLRLPLSSIPAAEVDGRLLDRVGLSGPYAEPLVEDVVTLGPADRAGLRKGDRVLRINDVSPRDAAELRRLIRTSLRGEQVQPVILDVERGGRTLSVTVQPVIKEVQGQKVARIEAALGSMPALVEVRYGFVEGLGMALEKTWDTAVLSLRMLGKMLIGEASIKNLSGPLTIADYAGKSATLGWVHYLGFLALVSVSLGVLNLLPLPVLDGGHLMYYLFEGVTGRPVSEVWLDRLQRGGMAIMLAMMSLALYNDLARLFGAH